jgi:hypothetical protein
MLVLCYGVTKSGSTLAFELVRGILESAGHAQERLPDGPVNPGHPINYSQPLNKKRLNQLLAAVGERWIAVKTHGGIGDPMFAYLDELADARKLQVIVSYRDPRDICLSLVDAGVNARAIGMVEFSEIGGLDTAAATVSEQIEKFVKWAALRNALLLYYDVVAFSPDRAIALIEETLGLRSDRERVKRYAYEEAFTEKNRARRDRHRAELTPQQDGELRRAFGEIIANFSEGEPDAWRAQMRQTILARLAAAETAPPPAG